MSYMQGWRTSLTWLHNESQQSPRSRVPSGLTWPRPYPGGGNFRLGRPDSRTAWRRFEGPVRQWRRLCSRFQTTTPTRMGLALPGSSVGHEPRLDPINTATLGHGLVSVGRSREGVSQATTTSETKSTTSATARPAHALLLMTRLVVLRIDARDRLPAATRLPVEVIRRRRAT